MYPAQVGRYFGEEGPAARSAQRSLVLSFYQSCQRNSTPHRSNPPAGDLFHPPLCVKGSGRVGGDATEPPVFGVLRPFDHAKDRGLCHDSCSSIVSRFRETCWSNAASSSRTTRRRYGVQRLCRIPGIARSSFHYWRTAATSFGVFGHHPSAPPSTARLRPGS